MTISISQELKRIFEGFEFDEARHARYVSPNPDIAAEDQADDEGKYTDFVSDKLMKMQTTIEEIKAAIEREQAEIRTGGIGAQAGNAKIGNWQKRLNDLQYNAANLQKALEQYMNDQSEDNEINLRIASTKARNAF